MSAKQQAKVSKTMCTIYNNIENGLSSLANCCNPKNTELLQTTNHFLVFSLRTVKQILINISLGVIPQMTRCIVTTYQAKGVNRKEESY